MSVVNQEDRLLAATREYQAALEAHRPPDRAAFLARHADLSDLAGYLDTLDELHQLSPSAPVTPEALGDFRIVREIGRGGMGIVYEAEQLSLGRRVALKVLPFAAAFDAKQLARFHNEARAAAQLHHTNIVPVFGVGSDRGVHFYAMQLIDGRTLAELIASMRLAAQPSRETAVAGVTVGSTPDQGQEYDRQVARLMVQAARALEHAHTHGVVHRDIKPANLMLDGHGLLWVTDFGLAQLSSGLELTVTGDLVGTLRYMSPEQASGQKAPLDHRTDVYSLGATFYELLTLTPLFDGVSRPEVLQQIVRDEPRPPRAIRKGVPVELETILLKCLSKSPADRYATAGELAVDLERFLAHRPILARRPSLVERARKWARRHPAVVGVALALLALTTAGLLVNHALVAREQARTRQALEREKVRAAEAERRLEQSRQLVELLIQIGDEELDDNHLNQGLRKRLLEAALGHYQKLIDETRDDPAGAGLAAARERVRQVLADLVTLQRVDGVLLLSIDAVLDELKPDDEQREQMREMVGRMNRERMDTLFDRELTPAQKRQRQLEQARASEQELQDLLGPAQQKRLRQVALQMQGMLALRDPDIVGALALTPDQRHRIREIEAECFKPGPGFGRKPGPGPGPKQGPKPGGPGPDPGARFREGMERCLALLTPAQRAKWDELAGPGFKMPPRPPFRPPPR